MGLGSGYMWVFTSSYHESELGSGSPHPFAYHQCLCPDLHRGCCQGGAEVSGLILRVKMSFQARRPKTTENRL